MTYKELFKDNTYLLEEPKVKELILKCDLLEQKLYLAERYIKGITDDTKSYTSVWFDYQASIIAATPMRVAIPPNCIKEWESTAYCGEEGKCLKCITK